MAGLLTAAVVAGVLLWTAAERGLRVEPPAPRPGDWVSTLPPLPPSELGLVLTYEIDGVLEELERLVPVRVGDVDLQHEHPSIDGLRYAFEAERGPLELALSGDTVHLSTTLHYQGRGWYDPGFLPGVSGACPLPAAAGPDAEMPSPAPRPRARVSFALPLAVSPEWDLDTRLEVTGIEPATPGIRDRCRVTAFQLDITDWILILAQGALEDWVTRLNEEVDAFDLRRVVMEGSLAGFETAFPVGEGAWLDLGTQRVRLGRAELAGSLPATLRLPVAFQVRPQLHVGMAPPLAGGPLPPLDRGEVDGEAFHVVADVQVTYPFLSGLVAAELDGREFGVRGRSLRVEGVRVDGLGDGRINLTLDVSGDLWGRVYLVGTPVYDSVGEAIRIPDLEVHVATRNVLAQVAAWVLRTGLAGELRRRVEWSVPDLRSRIDGAGSGPMLRELGAGGRLSADVGTFELEGLAAEADALRVRIGVEGAARLEVEAR